ncbi:MAG TPA: hypothetical protein VFV33_18980 [Gemmatimonadaceae bacterium]|nr:hypothetical protein [Gemmatimonadaceae bacterium]
MTTPHLARAIVAFLLLGVAVGGCAGDTGRTETVAAASAALPVLEVTATEYAFQAPDSVPPGRTVVRLKNLGRVVHEVIVMKLRPGVNLDTLLAQPDRRRGFPEFVEGGNAVLFAPPGKTGSGELVVDLEPGRDYLLLCNFRDAEGKPMHSSLGMYRRVRVGTAPVAATPPAEREVVVLAGDYRFVAPDTLDAGPVEFRMRNVGRQRHEVSLGRLKVGVPARDFLDRWQRGEEIDSLYDDDGAVVTGYPTDDNRIAIRADLRAGHEYVIVCEFRDAPGQPTHRELGMAKGLLVRGR